jgi:AcrR family transcriptional regulator
LDVFNESTSRADRKEATARAVLEAARAEFERVGFERANIRAIARRARVSAGTVIHHHGDKRELLHAALFDDLERTLDGALARMNAGPTLEAQLSALTAAMFAYYDKRPQLSRTMLKESLFADEPWAGRFSAQVGRVHAAIARQVHAAIERGELTSHVDPRLVGAAYFSFFYFALIAWVQGGLPSPVALVDHLIAQHLAGLRPTPKKRKKR